jgi:hypothetical protein
VDLFRRHISEKLSDLQKKKTAVVPSAAGILAVSSNGSPRAQEVVYYSCIVRLKTETSLALMAVGCLL